MFPGLDLGESKLTNIFKGDGLQRVRLTEGKHGKFAAQDFLILFLRSKGCTFTSKLARLRICTCAPVRLWFLYQSTSTFIAPSSDQDHALTSTRKRFEDETLHDGSSFLLIEDDLSQRGS